MSVVGKHFEWITWAAHTHHETFILKDITLNSKTGSGVDFILGGLCFR